MLMLQQWWNSSATRMKHLTERRWNSWWVGVQGTTCLMVNKAEETIPKNHPDTTVDHIGLIRSTFWTFDRLMNVHTWPMIWLYVPIPLMEEAPRIATSSWSYDTFTRAFESSRFKCYSCCAFPCVSVVWPTSTDGVLMSVTPLCHALIYTPGL